MNEMTGPGSEGLPPRSHNLPEGIDVLPTLPLEISTAAIEEAVEALPVTKEPPPYNVVAHAAFALRVAAFCDACGKWADIKDIASKEQAERLGDFINGAKQLSKKVDEQRTADKSIHDARSTAVQSAFKLLLDKLDASAKKLKPMAAAWLEKEQARLAAEQAEAKRIADEKIEAARKQAAEALARNDVSGEVEAAAAMKDAEKAQKVASRDVKAKVGSASGAGRTMSMRTVQTAEIHSQNGVYMHFREHPDVIDLLQRLATAAVRAGVEFDPKILTVKKDQVPA